MSPVLTLTVILVYFSLVILVSWVAGRGSTSNDTFFRANRGSVWWAVAIGMVGSSMSGVSFVSVPGMVRGIDFTYLQFVLGFFFGYIIVAQVLLPVFYRQNLTSIYTYLYDRFGSRAYKTGAWFFIIGKIITSAAKLYIVALVLHNFVFIQWGFAFPLTVALTVLTVWLYTFRSGIKSIVWTDVLQTLIMIITLIVIVFIVLKKINLNLSEIFNLILHSEQTRIFVFDDWLSRQNFVKQFLSGIFIVVVMTGLDQDQMQKNLTCKNLHEAKKNMQCYGAAFVPVNLMFLVLGFLLLLYAEQHGISLQNVISDDILPLMVKNYLGTFAVAMFVTGIFASALNSADSALTALTTSFSIDILNIKNDKKAEKVRKAVHAGFAVVLVAVVMIFRALNSNSVIDALYTIVSYTYGPLLGMYAFGLFTKRRTSDKAIPLIAIAAPAVCIIINLLSTKMFDYTFGYEILLLNAIITFTAMGVVEHRI
ncbi:MAG: sodium:solute symporter [Prevotellaceae bacterium]|jgi:SSS family transporter|nr:sodium:solute symporter [Prevotellaceae bacterium]